MLNYLGGSVILQSHDTTNLLLNVAHKKLIFIAQTLIFFYQSFNCFYFIVGNKIFKKSLIVFLTDTTD